MTKFYLWFNHSTYLDHMIYIYIASTYIYSICEGLDAYSTCISVYSVYNTTTSSTCVTSYSCPDHLCMWFQVSTWLNLIYSFIIWYLMTRRGRHICTNFASLITKLPMHGLHRFVAYPTQCGHSHEHPRSGSHDKVTKSYSSSKTRRDGFFVHTEMVWHDCMFQHKPYTVNKTSTRFQHKLFKDPTIAVYTYISRFLNIWKCAFAFVFVHLI